MLSRPRGAAVGTGTSLALSSLLSLLLFAGMQMYSRQLASTEWLTIQGGLLGSALFVCSLTASPGTAEGPVAIRASGLATGPGGCWGARAKGQEWGWSREDGKWEQDSRIPLIFSMAAMTKLAQWLCALALLGSAWAALALAPPGLQPPAPLRRALLPLPVYLLVAFGCYSLATVGYRLATFNDCEEAAAELQEHIRAARADLRRRGLRLAAQ
ncbi:hypothetical protein DV515_00015631 [Chloebia gouldiae]|uniref:Dolichyl-diphosphooligosaccharide--protein glycosyltransferase subunit KCP2 n=1 Tax=Chloebia gouldiae TaxID=44316 RepID=A0A3L8RW87_CHLGU|nr:hypothetical protein DV515_00015631 [Chloebia gouldiae]